MKLKVQNETSRPIARGGFAFPPDGKWHEVVVPDYRAKEITSAAFLNVKVLDEPKQAEEPEVEDAEEPEVEDEGGRSDEGDGWDDEEDDVVIEDDDEIDLDELSYSDIQGLAKERGIRANQSREDLVEAILEADEDE